MRRAALLLAPRALRADAAASTTRAAATAPGAGPGDYGAAAGVPDHILQREVIIYAPARTASQQGMSNTATPLGKGGAWRIEFETKPKWVNPLMGWTSTADPLENVGRAALSFDSEAAARAFCERHGWKFTVKAPAPAHKLRPKHRLQYGDNFSVKNKGIPVGGLVSETMDAGGGSGKKRGKKSSA